MNKDNILDLLKKITYPGFSRDIVSFGMIKDIIIDNENVSLHLNVKSSNKEKKNQQPEEYVMNVVEFLSQPKYQHLLLKNGVISDIKRSTLNIANRIGLDYSNKKNFTTGEQMLEFLFSIGKVAEGGSASAIKNKFKAFSNIVIDGNKIYNRRSGKEISKEDINRAASKDFSKDIKFDVSAIEKRIEENRLYGPSNRVMNYNIEQQLKADLQRAKEIDKLETYTAEYVFDNLIYTGRKCIYSLSNEKFSVIEVFLFNE